MKALSRTMKFRLLSAALLAVVNGALCFSAGEGLRLRPFPTIPDQPEIEQKLSQYGPLNVPVQNQKRNKRQTVEFAVPASPGIHAAAASLFSLVDDKTTNGPSILFVARPSGRAPPFLS